MNKASCQGMCNSRSLGHCNPQGALSTRLWHPCTTCLEQMPSSQSSVSYLIHVLDCIVVVSAGCILPVGMENVISLYALTHHPHVGILLQQRHNATATQCCAKDMLRSNLIYSQNKPVTSCHGLAVQTLSIKDFKQPQVMNACTSNVHSGSCK